MSQAAAGRALDRPSGVPAGPAGDALAEAVGLTAGYGGLTAIDGVSFRVRPGERVALLGPNGGGKTTLLRSITGEADRISGSLRVNAPWASVPQTERSRLDYPVSALDVALMGALASLPWWRQPGRRERAAAAAALDQVGMGKLADTTFGELSAGQRQRVLIARGLVQDARLLLLDEPFTGLDASSADRLETLIGELASEGRGILIATHDLEQARRLDLVVCLNRRQIAFGPPGEVLDLAVLEATYGGAIVEIPDQAGLGILPPHHHHRL
jgi:ABC-type Mn2+/Zn2+ transport system ATPase subunit